jgi:hypothetical protein
MARSPRRRRREAFLLVVLGTALAAAVAWLGGNWRTFDVRLPAFLKGARESPPPGVRPPQPEAVLRREVGSLRALVTAAARGELLPPDDERALVALSQGQVEALLRAQLPSSHLVAQRFRVVVSTAHVWFDDGLALVRLEGRVRLEDAPEGIYADLTVHGDLHLAPREHGAQALRLGITVTAVEARRVELGVRAPQADRLVEEIGQAQAALFAALAPELDVPVRWEYLVVIPGLGPRGPVGIEEASVRIGLQIHEVRALAGRLWLAVDMSVGAAVAADAQPPAHTAPAEALEDPALLRAEHARLHETLTEHLSAHPVLSQVLASQGDLTFVLPRGLFTMLAEEIAIRYLDRVTLSLDGIRVTRDGEVQSNTLLGKVHSGDWRLRVDLDQVRGVLRAGRPRIALQSGRRIGVVVPVRIDEGHGQAALHFSWDSRGLANVVCRDFEVRDNVAGAVVKESHDLEGVVTLEAEGDDLRLVPRFERRQRIHVTPSADSWATIERALEGQDRLFRCGLALKPDAVLARLQAVVGKGFVVKLPESLFRPVGLPKVFLTTLHVADREVEVSAIESTLVTDPQRAMLSLRLRVTLPDAPGGERVEVPPGSRRTH